MNSATLLSKENLRMHNATTSESNTYSQANRVQEGRSRTAEHESNHYTFDNYDDWGDAYSDVYDGEMTLRREAALDALKVYAGAFVAFQADIYAHAAKDMLDESGMRFGDRELEQLDLGQLASELIHIEVTLDDTRGSSIGSPSPSSDTLSVSRYRELRSAREEGTRNRKRVRVRRRDTLGSANMPRSILHDTAK